MFKAGSNLSLRLAQTQEDHQAAQRLRYRVFIQELGGDGAARAAEGTAVARPPPGPPRGAFGGRRRLDASYGRSFVVAPCGSTATQPTFESLQQ